MSASASFRSATLAPIHRVVLTTVLSVVAAAVVAWQPSATLLSGTPTEAAQAETVEGLVTPRNALQSQAALAPAFQRRIGRIS